MAPFLYQRVLTSTKSDSSMIVEFDYIRMSILYQGVLTSTESDSSIVEFDYIRMSIIYQSVLISTESDSYSSSTYTRRRGGYTIPEQDLQ